MILTQALLDHWEFGPGDEVFFIGRYVDAEGKAHNAPTVRSGILSTCPAEPILQDKMHHRQESFLVEARSLSGYSGSPVFVTPSAFIQSSGEFGGAPAVRHLSHGPCYLLGIDWGHTHWRESVDEKIYVSNSGMMTILPAMKLLSLLDIEEFAEMRREVEQIESRIIEQSSSPEA